VGGKSGYYEIAKLRTIHYWEELPNLVYPKDAIEQDAEMEANAALISAAPDLYAALDNLVYEVQILADKSFHEDSKIFIEEAIAALAKARGE
jgi:hypothetical protein